MRITQLDSYNEQTLGIQTDQANNICIMYLISIPLLKLADGQGILIKVSVTSIFCQHHAMIINSQFYWLSNRYARRPPLVFSGP